MDSDAQLDARFAALFAGVAEVARPAPVAVVRARGDRRRRTRGAGLASAGLAVLVAIAVVAAVTAGGLGRAPTAPATDPAAPPDSIPTAFRLSHHGNSAWIRADGIETPGIFRPCAGEDQTVGGRTDAIGEMGPGVPLATGQPPAWLSDQLLLFRDDDASGAAMQALVAAKDRCGWSTVAVDLVPGYDTDVLMTDRYLDGNGRATSRDKAASYESASVLRRGAVLWIQFEQVQGVEQGGYDGGAVDVRAELCSLMRLCYPPAT